MKPLPYHLTLDETVSMLSCSQQIDKHSRHSTGFHLRRLPRLMLLRECSASRARTSCKRIALAAESVTPTWSGLPALLSSRPQTPLTGPGISPDPKHSLLTRAAACVGSSAAQWRFSRLATTPCSPLKRSAPAVADYSPGPLRRRKRNES